MNEALRIYVERLRTHGTEQINESVPSDFIDLKEADVQFTEPVTLKGEAYLAHDELVVKLEASTRALMPCAVCNEPVAVTIIVKDLMNMVPLRELKRGVFDMTQMLREAILLELPLIAECNEGNCPGRKEIEQYLRKKKGSDGDDDEGGYQPFADLDQPKKKKKK